MHLLFDVEAHDGGVMGIEVDLIHSSDWYACDENLAAGLESCDVGESGIHFVSRATNYHARAGLYRVLNNGGLCLENKRAETQFDV